MKKHNAIVAAALAALALAGLSPTASAAPVDHVSPVTAQVGVALGPLGDLSIPITGGTYTGTVDQDTGAITGEIDFPATTSDIQINGSPATAKTTLGVDGLSGTIAAGGAVTATGTFHLNLMELKTGSDPAIGLDPCNWSGDATFTGTFDDATNELTIGQTGFAFDPSNDTCGGLNALLTGYLTDDATDLSFTIGLEAPLPPSTTTTTTASTTTSTATPSTTTAPPAPASAAEPVSAAADFTG